MKRVLAWVPAVAWAGLLFYLSSLPSLRIAPAVPHLDKAAHAAVYLVLGVLLAVAVDRVGWPAAAAVALGMLYGVSDEVHQMYVPGRSASVADWLADTAGVFAGVYLHARLRAPGAGWAARRPDPVRLRE